MTIIKNIFTTIIALLLICILFSACTNNKENNMDFEKKVNNNVYLENENVSGLKESELKKRILNLSSKVECKVQNAVYDQNRWKVVSNEIAGKKVDVQKTLQLVLNSEEGEKVNLVVSEIKPNIKAIDYTKNITTIGSFKTPLLNKSSSRINNIKIASDKINGKILNPGEEFSFNQSLGRRTRDKGYEKAPIIIKKRKAYGVGGGVCQLSSTIFNAAKEAGLEITERHGHSKKVGYVAPGNDATISYDDLDFRFRNTRKNPIMIRINLLRNTLVTEILEKVG